MRLVSLEDLVARIIRRIDAMSDEEVGALLEREIARARADRGLDEPARGLTSLDARDAPGAVDPQHEDRVPLARRRRQR